MWEWKRRFQEVFALVVWVVLVLLFCQTGQAQDPSAFLTVEVQPNHFFVVYETVQQFQAVESQPPSPHQHPQPAKPIDNPQPLQSPTQAPVLTKQSLVYGDCNQVQKAQGNNVQRTYGWFGGGQRAARRANRRASRGGWLFRGGC